MKKYLIAVVLASTVILPFLASAQSADVQAQMNALLAQIQAIQARINALIAGNANLSGGTGGVTLTSVTSAPIGRAITIEGTGFSSNNNFIKIDSGYARAPVRTNPAPKNDAICYAAAVKSCLSDLAATMCPGGKLWDPSGQVPVVVCPPGSPPPDMVGRVPIDFSFTGTMPKGESDVCYNHATNQCPYKGSPNPQLSVQLDGVVCMQKPEDIYANNGPAILLSSGSHTVSVENKNGTSNMLTFNLTGPSIIERAVQSRESFIGRMTNLFNTVQGNINNGVGDVARQQEILKRLQWMVDVATKNLNDYKALQADPTNTSLIAYKILAQFCGQRFDLPPNYYPPAPK